MMLFPSSANFRQKVVNLLLCTDIDASRRLIENQDVAFCAKPFGQNDLLLVAAAQIFHLLVEGGSLDVEQSGNIRANSLFALLPQKTEPGESLENRERDVFLDAHPEQDSLLFSVFGEQADAMHDGILRLFDLYRLPRQEYPALGKEIGAEQGPCEFGSAGADETSNSKYLPFPQVERYVFQFFVLETFDEKSFGSGARFSGRINFVEVAADHERYKFLLVGRSYVLGYYFSTVPQYADSIAYPEISLRAGAKYK